MTCNHQWHDATTKAGPEWVCAKCKVTYTSVKPTGFVDSKRNPIKREWVGLTEQEIAIQVSYDCTLEDMVRSVETKLKEKNT
jgi:hypothetical protein